MRNLILTAVLLFTSGALAADEHCHVAAAKGGNPNGGAVRDEPSANSKQSCSELGGVWTSHAAHCHVVGDKRTVDLPTANDESRCAKAGGRWRAHGHEAH